MSITSALSRAYRGTKNVNIHHGAGIVSEAIDTAEYVGASYLFGQIHGRYREKAEISILGKSVPVNLLVGVAGKVAAIGMQAVGVVPKAAHHVNTLANAGLGSFAHGLGVSHGMQASGRKLYVLDPGKNPALASDYKETDVVGDLGQAPRGAYLSMSELQGVAAQ